MSLFANLYPAMDQQLVTRIVEAALLAANQPLTLAQLHALFPEDAPAPTDSVETALQTLREGCAERGVELVELASGFRFQVQADVHAWVARLWTERQTKYTRATLETLALIAYRQPITRGEIEQVRGVAVNSNIIKALEEREWIRVVGHRDVPGKPALFGTTKIFLDYFGLKRLDELPPLSELKDLGELEPQFQFDAAPEGGMPIGDIAADENDEKGSDSFSGLDEPGDETTSDEKESDPFSENESLALTGEPEAAPGERAVDTNDIEDDNAVETTPVETTDDDAELASSEQKDE